MTQGIIEIKFNILSIIVTHSRPITLHVYSRAVPTCLPFLKIYQQFIVSVIRSHFSEIII